MSVPADRNISVKEYEKLAKYKDLEIEINRMWHLRTITLPIVVGALGMSKKGSSDFIDHIPGKSNICEVQKIALTSTAHFEEIPFNVVIDFRNHQKIMTIGQLSRRTVLT